jgi:hypothetical protein
LILPLQSVTHQKTFLTRQTFQLRFFGVMGPIPESILENWHLFAAHAEQHLENNLGRWSKRYSGQIALSKPRNFL